MQKGIGANLKNQRDLAMLRISGRILSETLAALKKEAFIGQSLQAIDDKARRLIEKAGGKPAFLGYRPPGSPKAYPASTCLSLNDQVVHGLPGDIFLKEGDILKIDCGVNYEGYITDSAITVSLGNISKEAQKLMSVTREALVAGIAECVVGKTLGDIGSAIEELVKENGFSVVANLTGHSVGFALHEDPAVYNYGRRGEGMELIPGLVLAIEPMVSAGKGAIRQQPDGSFSTKDGSLAAHFEQTVAIVENGPEILTPFL